MFATLHWSLAVWSAILSNLRLYPPLPVVFDRLQFQAFLLALPIRLFFVVECLFGLLTWLFLYFYFLSPHFPLRLLSDSLPIVLLILLAFLQVYVAGFD